MDFLSTSFVTDSQRFTEWGQSFYFIGTDHDIQSNLYLEVTFETKRKWPYKTGDLLKEVQLI
jgi:hypothetical protein